MSFYNLPGGWNPGYAIPEYIQAEVPGRGTMTTKWLPRGTISTLYPDVLMQPELKVKALGAAERFLLTPIQQKSAWTTVGDVEKSTNPFAQGSQQIADYLVDELKTVPAPFRKIALKATLDAVNPSLFPAAGALAKKYKSEGMPANAALKRALGEQITKGFIKELSKAGRTGKIELKGQLGLSAYVNHANAEALGNIFGRIGGGIADVAGAAYGGVKAGASAAWNAVEGGAKATGRGASAAWGYGKRAAVAAAKYSVKAHLLWIKMQCRMLNLPGADVAATSIAAAYGAPPVTTGSGVKIAKGLCQKYVTGSPGNPPLSPPTGIDVPDFGMPPGYGTPGMPGYNPVPSKTPSWVLPAAIGAGGLLLFLAMK